MSPGLQAEGLPGGWLLRKDFLESWPWNEVSYLGWWKEEDATQAVAHGANQGDERSQALGIDRVMPQPHRWEEGIGSSMRVKICTCWVHC